MAVKYITWDKIPKKDKSTEGALSGVPLNAAGVPYKLYEYNPNSFPKYYGMSDRMIKKIENPSPQIKKIQDKIRKGVYAP